MSKTPTDEQRARAKEFWDMIDAAHPEFFGLGEIEQWAAYQARFDELTADYIKACRQARKDGAPKPRYEDYLPVGEWD